MESSVERDGGDETLAPIQTSSFQASQPSRRLSVQDRINLFENKQKENSGGKPVVVKPVELKRLSSDVSMMGAAADKAVLRRWSGVSDMSIELSAEKKDTEIPMCTHSSDLTEVKDQGSSLAQNRPIGEGGANVRTSNPIEDIETRDKSVVESGLMSTWKTVEESWVFEGVSDSRLGEAFADQHKEIDNDSSAQQELRSTGQAEVVERNEALEDSGPQRMKYSRKVSASELTKKAKVLPDGSNRTPFSGKVTTEAQAGFDSFATPTPEQFQRGRHSKGKGSQDRNDELKMKANELEKLFAEHQLRVPADQSTSARKGKVVDGQPTADISPQHPDKYKSNELIGKNKTKLNAEASMKIIDSQNYGGALKKSFSELSVSEGSRGKLYHRYIQKRDAKLKEDWSSNRVDKEARLKSMQDSLERNKSEMKDKLSRTADRQDARRRAERLRSYNSRSILKREQQHLDFGDCEFDDEALDFQEKNRHSEDRAVSNICFEDGFSSGIQGKKLLPNNINFSSTTPRPSATPVARFAAKTSTSSVKRRMQPENPLAQSVPNFSDLRKENTKPFSGAGKARSQVRNYARSKSTAEETIVKEDKSRRLQALRKSSANPSDSKDILTQIKFDEDILKNAGPKPFLRKGSRATRTSIARHRASAGSQPINNDDENDDIASEPDEYYNNTVKDERDEEVKTLNTEGDDDLEDREPPLDQYVNSESENGDETLTFSALDQALGSQLPREIPSCFLPVDSMQDWQNGSPMLWNSRTQHPFSYPHETSDIDASVDSPLGSPSWNMHSVNPMEADAARMRKKWGTAQKPMIVTHTSNSSPRKDMTRGFKRLLKFGRKSRGSETLADWVSATTSEGDDDTEDGRDPANRSSEDLRKSRMGFSLAQPSDDGFNESEFFNESAPRSFFSLSTFRSKGNESKPR